MPGGYIPTTTAKPQPFKSLPGSVTSARPAVSSVPAAPNPMTGAYGSPQNPFDFSVQPQSSPLQDPGNNMTNPGYTEQAVNTAQDRLLEDPYEQYQQWLAAQAQTPSAGETALNNGLGSLQGPGNGQQYWNQQQGQFNDPFAGEQFARQATQNYSPTGPAGAFFDQAMGQYGDFTGYSGPQASAGQYGANASSGPLAGQQFYDQVGGSYDQTGRYTDPNLAAGQYAQTQQAFGDLPIANFDPFYDRARQLATQSYNQGAAGRGVYGSSEALSGVGNVITDIEAQRANRSFDAEMQREQANQGRQTILGNQARAGDLSSLSAFGANLSGLETFGNLAKTAGDQTLGQQTMLGNQARDVDTAAQAAQTSNIAGLNAFGNLASSADTSEQNRYRDSTAAMNAADRTQIDRVRAGADIADMADDNERGDYEAETNAATNAARARDNRLQTGSNIATGGSQADLNRLDSFMQGSDLAEDDRQKRQESYRQAETETQKIIQGMIASGMDDAFKGDQQAFNDYVQTNIVPQLQAAGFSEQEIQKQISFISNVFNGVQTGVDRATEDDD